MDYGRSTDEFCKVLISIVILALIFLIFDTKVIFCRKKVLRRRFRDTGFYKITQFLEGAFIGDFCRKDDKEFFRIVHRDFFVTIFSFRTGCICIYTYIFIDVGLIFTFIMFLGANLLLLWFRLLIVETKV